MARRAKARESGVKFDDAGNDRWKHDALPFGVSGAKDAIVRPEYQVGRKMARSCYSGFDIFDMDVKKRAGLLASSAAR